MRCRAGWGRPRPFTIASKSGAGPACSKRSGRQACTGLLEYNTDIGLDFEWQSLDGCITKAPLGGEATGPNPTDRGKSGTKRHLLTEAAGIPIGLVVTGANRHDKTQVEAVFESMPLLSPPPSAEQPQHFCADKGYDFRDVRSTVGFMQMIDHITDDRSYQRPG